MVGLQDSITAITLVALGTSLPDTFASKIAAENVSSNIGEKIIPAELNHTLRDIFSNPKIMQQRKGHPSRRGRYQTRLRSVVLKYSKWNLFAWLESPKIDGPLDTEQGTRDHSGNGPGYDSL